VTRYPAGFSMDTEGFAPTQLMNAPAWLTRRLVTLSGYAATTSTLVRVPWAAMSGFHARPLVTTAYS
jgi:hypothetical protein